jgi:hypothetical protein
VFSYNDHSKIKHNRNDAVEVVKGIHSYRISDEVLFDEWGIPRLIFFRTENNFAGGVRLSPLAFTLKKA